MRVKVVGDKVATTKLHGPFASMTEGETLLVVAGRDGNVLGLV
jgi:hypothetical protein